MLLLRIWTALYLLLAPGFSLAATSPFGIATPDSPIGNTVGGPFAPLLLYAIRMQSQFYQKLTAQLDAFSSDPHAGLWLVGLSFLYGIFHAVGPGHGKAVIASYLVATGDTRRRAVALSILASFVQGLSAIIIISVATLILHVTAVEITQATSGIELVSYGLVVLLGVMLLVSQGRNLPHAWRLAKVQQSQFVCQEIPRGITSLEDIPEQANANERLHGVNCACVEVNRLVVTQPEVTYKAMLAAVVSIGIRPCSGGLIVLVFALSRHLFLAGLASVFAMSGGTALTVSLVALLSGTARNLLQRLTASDQTLSLKLSAIFQFTAATVVFTFGLIMFAGTLTVF